MSSSLAAWRRGGVTVVGAVGVVEVNALRSIGDGGLVESLMS